MSRRRTARPAVHSGRITVAIPDKPPDQLTDAEIDRLADHVGRVDGAEARDHMAALLRGEL